MHLSGEASSFSSSSFFFLMNKKLYRSNSKEYKTSHYKPIKEAEKSHRGFFFPYGPIHVCCVYRRSLFMVLAWSLNYLALAGPFLLICRFLFLIYISREKQKEKVWVEQKEKRMLLSLVLLSERSSETSLEENTHPAVRT